MLRFVVALAALAAILLPAASAQAAVFSNDGGRLRVTAAPGEQNVVSVVPLDTGPVIVRDDGPGVTPTGCGPYTPWEGDVPGDLICFAVRAPIVELGDQDDRVLVRDAGTEDLIGVTEVDGGTGDDTITTGYSGDILRGGEGDDTIDGGELGDDRLEGGPGRDTLRGKWGADTILPGPGADVVEAGDADDVIDAVDGTADTIDCGDGADTVKADAADVLTACEAVTRVGGAADAPGPRPDKILPLPVGPMTPVETTPAPVAPRAVRSVQETDRRAPTLVVRAKRRTLTLTCDEACTVTVKAGARTATRRLAANRAARLRVPGRARTAKISARDAAGNVRAATRRLAKAR